MAMDLLTHIKMTKSSTKTKSVGEEFEFEVSGEMGVLVAFEERGVEGAMTEREGGRWFGVWRRKGRLQEGFAVEAAAAAACHLPPIPYPLLQLQFALSIFYVSCQYTSYLHFFLSWVFV